MAKKEQKERGGKRMTNYNGRRASTGIDELSGYYFAHGDHGPGNKPKAIRNSSALVRFEAKKSIDSI